MLGERQRGFAVSCEAGGEQYYTYKFSDNHEISLLLMKGAFNYLYTCDIHNGERRMIMRTKQQIRVLKYSPNFKDFTLE